MIDNKQIFNASIEYGTPFYIYDRNRLWQTYNLLRTSLHPSLNIFLSLKANNNISIANLFKSWGAGIEVASKGELFLALKAGFSPKDIIFSGPGKNDIEIEQAINDEIYSIIVESIQEIELIYSVCKRMNKKAKIGLRINPDFIDSEATIKMGGAPRQFGIDESIAWQAIDLLLEKNEFIEFNGIHVYMGTQILNEIKILENIEYTLKIARKINEIHQISCPFVNIGGGLGIAYFQNEVDIDIQILTNSINKKIDQFINDYPNTRIIIESGRYLLAKSGYYVSKILYKKESKGEKFVVIDGGMSHHTAPTFRGRFIRNNYPIKIIKKNHEEIADLELETINIVGPLCTPEDIIGRSVQLPYSEVGDLILISHSGAYGLSYSPVYFLGHSTPLELLMTDNGLSVIRERGNEEDLLLHQIVKDENG